jgi:hypothetical protein
MLRKAIKYHPVQKSSGSISHHDVHYDGMRAASTVGCVRFCDENAREMVWIKDAGADQVAQNFEQSARSYSFEYICLCAE